MDNIKRFREIRDRLRAVHAATTRARDELREDEAALDSDYAQERLTKSYRATRRVGLRQEALKKVGKGVVEELATARSTLALRDELLGVDSILSGARFAPPPLEPPDYSRNLEGYRPGEVLFNQDKHERREQHRATMNLQGKILEQTTRTRYALELPKYTEPQLAALARTAAVERNAALVDMVRREVASRNLDAQTPGVAALKVAVEDAIQSLPLPPDLQEAATLLDEIERLSATPRPPPHSARSTPATNRLAICRRPPRALMRSLPTRRFHR